MRIPDREKLFRQTKTGRNKRLRALVRKEFLQIKRDPSAILISLVLPLLLLFIYAFGVSLDMDHLKIGLVLEDTAPDARSFAETLTNSPYFDVTIARDRRALDRKLIAGEIRGIVVVPSYFSAYRQRPDQVAPIQVIADGSEPNTAHFVHNYVQGAWATWLQQEKIGARFKELPLVKVEPRYWYNEELESRNFLIPGSLAIIMTLIGTLLTALVIAREWERGTMEALMSTPVTMGELVISKLVPYYILALTAMGLCVLLAVGAFGVPLRGSILALALVSGVFLLPALALGLLISTLSKSQLVAAQVSIVAGFLPAFILSGFVFEIASMPIPIQMLTYLMPARYLVTCLQTVFLAGDIWPLFLPNLVPMLVIGALFFGITARKTVKRLD